MVLRANAVTMVLAMAAGPAVGDAAPASVSDVRIAWSDSGHTAVRVTWSETSPAPNTVRLVTGGGSRVLGETAQTDPNELLVAGLGATDSPAAVDTVVVDAGSGDAGRSVGFDRFLPSDDPRATFLPGGAIRLDVPSLSVPDATPNDPLDLTGTISWAVNKVVPPPPDDYYGCHLVELPAINQMPHVLPYPATSYRLHLRVSNEWGQRWPSIEVQRSRVSVTAPASGMYGAVTTISGPVTSTGFFESGHPPMCRPITDAPSSVVLHARRNSASPWAAVAVAKVDRGRYTFRFGMPGTRQYRVVVPNQYLAAGARDYEVAIYGSVSEVRTVTAVTRVLSARFADPTVTRGQKATAMLAVLPAGSQRALLQYRTPSGAWRGLLYKSLRSGRGSATITWVRRGATAFRWYMPASTTPSGLRVEAAFSRPFPLTVG